jgi:adenylate cyclase
MGGGHIKQLEDLRAPMAVILSHVAEQMSELEKYKAKYGPLESESSQDEGSDTEQEGSDTEQE